MADLIVVFLMNSETIFQMKHIRTGLDHVKSLRIYYFVIPCGSVWIVRCSPFLLVGFRAAQDQLAPPGTRARQAFKACPGSEGLQERRAPRATG